MAVLVQTLINRIRRRADLVNNAVVSDSNDLLPWVAGSYKELFELLVTTYGPTYFMLVSTFTVSATGTAAIGPVLKLLRLDCAFNSERVPMRPMNLSDQILSDTATSWNAGTDVRYHFEGTGAQMTGSLVIRFHPRPSSAQLVKCYYIPPADILTSLSDAIGGAVEAWDEYIVIDGAIKAKVKVDEDVQALVLAKAEMKQRIIANASPLDAGQPQTIADVRAAHNEPRRWWRGWW